jgi:hypothetical protein
MFSISSFKQNINVVRPNQFFAEVYFPVELQNAFQTKNKTVTSPSTGQEYTVEGSVNIAGVNWWNSFDGRDINNTFRFRCEATELPGRTISTSDDQAYGPMTKFAYETSYQDVSLQIICSEDMRERAMFEIWMENIINQTDLKGGDQSRAGLAKYYDQYASGQVRIYQVGGGGTVKKPGTKQLARYTLYNAYPIQMSPMNLSWEEQNTYQRFSVTITYRYHVVDFTQGLINLR